MWPNMLCMHGDELQKFFPSVVLLYIHMVPMYHTLLYN